jgi:hypothetical protein
MTHNKGVIGGRGGGRNCGGYIENRFKSSDILKLTTDKVNYDRFLFTIGNSNVDS